MPSLEGNAPKPSKHNGLKVVKGAKKKKTKRIPSYGEDPKSSRKRNSQSISKANNPKRSRKISETTRNVAIRCQPEKNSKRG